MFLLHQAGLVPFITFYRETIDTATGIPNPAIYSDKSKPGFTVRVAENLYMRNDWSDTILKRILKSPVASSPKYVYSDNDFIFLGKVVEAITGMTLDQYVQKTFYNKMGLTTTGFKPRNRFPLDQLVPTETRKIIFAANRYKAMFMMRVLLCLAALPGMRDYFRMLMILRCYTRCY